MQRVAEPRVGGVERIYEGGRVDGGRFRRIVLREKVVAVVRIRVTGAAFAVFAVPRHGTFGKEQASARNVTGGHLLQVVLCDKLAAHQLFVDEVSAIAVELHL